MRRIILWVIVCLSIHTVQAQQNIVTLPENLALIWEQIAAQPDDFGTACMPLQNPGQTVLYNGAAFPLASVSKLLIFLEYARRVDSGLIPLDETISVAQLERYNLPRTDRGAHDRFIASYPTTPTILPLWEVATQGMIQYSSNAASDYLLDRMAPIDWEALYMLLGISATSYPNSLTMIPLMMNNHETGMATMQTIADLSAEQGETFLDLYVDDDTWRQAEIAYRSQGRRSFPAWDVQSAILQAHTATGNVNDFRIIMRAIYDTVSPLSENVRYMARTAMQWRNSDFVDQNYAEYGSKLGYYSGGVLTLVAYGKPYAGSPVITVIFFRNIPQVIHRDLLREDSIGDLAHWMILNGCSGLRDLITSSTS